MQLQARLSQPGDVWFQERQPAAHTKSAPKLRLRIDGYRPGCDLGLIRTAGAMQRRGGMTPRAMVMLAALAAFRAMIFDGHTAPVITLLLFSLPYVDIPGKGNNGLQIESAGSYNSAMPSASNSRQFGEKLLESNVTGTVKWFRERILNEGGEGTGGHFGFIIRDDGAANVFVHGSDVEMLSYPLVVGRQVIFDIVEGRRGPKAVNVVMLPDEIP
jgi:cold shock CspA family protein